MTLLARRLIEELLGGEPDAAELERVVARLGQLAEGQRRLRDLDLSGEEPLVEFSLERS